MLKTVEGIYQNGQIELTEIPENVSDRAQVIVTFLEPGKINPLKLRQLIDQSKTQDLRSNTTNGRDGALRCANTPYK